MRRSERPQDAGELRARLLAWLAHESESGRRQLLDLWSLTLPERVESGDCLAGLRLVEVNGNGVASFTCPDFSAKFRDGEPLYLGEQRDAEAGDVESGLAVSFVDYDVRRQVVRVQPDRLQAKEPFLPDRDADYCLDRRDLGTEGLLREGLDAVFHAENAHCLEVLLGQAFGRYDAGRRERGLAQGASASLVASQREALARAVATEGVTLIQGPPGTGKTRVLAETALLLARQRLKVFVSGFTHRAIHNVLEAVRALDAQVPIFKVTSNSEQAAELRRLGIGTARKLEHIELRAGGAVVGGTPFAARRFSPQRRFHFVLIDEAGQMPVVHGAIAMTQARRVVVVGDPCQLAPVRQGERDDPRLGTSLYDYLAHWDEGLLLDESFRLNEQLVDFPSREFYGGRLRSAPTAARARLKSKAGGDHPGGDLADLLDPERSLVVARVDHLGRTRRSPEEARLVVDVVAELLRRHELRPAQIAVLCPFRTQVRFLRDELQRAGLYTPELVVDTVERMQGQEREVVLVCLTASDRDYLTAQAEFFFDAGKLNVSLTRARTKCIVVASKEAFRARPSDVGELLAAARFKRLLAEAPQVDLTERYAGG